MRIKFLLKLSVICLLIFASATSYAQVKKITGKVTDPKSGQPMPGVTVTVKGKQTAVATNVDGVYSIQADPAKDALIFSIVGYVRQEAKIDGKASVNMTMEEDQAKLDEVVVVGYGTKKRADVIGAVATIKGSEIADIPAPDIAGALRNRIAGVGVSAASGRPGAAITLNIRGAQTSPNTTQGTTTEPLYVIDGVISTTDQFNAIDPALVEDLTVLKDASAAIYGASGSKGVILITTKRGKIGKPKITYNGYVGVSDAAKTPKMLTAYEQASLINDNLDQQGGNTPDKYFSQSDLNFLKTNPYKSWYDELWQAAVMQRHNVQLSGGSEKMTFFIGGSYQKENANYAGMNNTKYGFRSGVTATFSESLKADVSFNLNYNSKYSNNNLIDNDQTFFQTMITTPQWVPIQLHGLPNNAIKINPLALINSGYYTKNASTDYTLNAALNYTPKLIPGLNVRLQIAQNGTAGHGTTYTAPYKQYNFPRWGNNGALYKDTIAPTPIEVVAATGARYEPTQNYSSRYQADITASYARSFGKHSISALIGGEQSESNSEDLDVYLNNQVIPGRDEIWAFDGTQFTFKSNTKIESIKQSFFGRFSYDFSKKYLIDIVGRFDASTIFATKNAWGFFPNAGAAWILSEEDFFKKAHKLNFISFLKLKANYGLTGDDRVNARLWQATFSVDPANTGYVYNSANAPSANPSQIPNPDITWEKKRTINIGLETSLLNGKINFGFDYFHDYIYDQFDKGGNNIYPMDAGFAAATVNNERRHAYGTEFTLGYNGKIVKDLAFSTSVNFGFSAGYVAQVYMDPSKYFQNTPTDWQIAQGTNPKVYNSANIGLIATGLLKTQADVDALLKQYPNYTIYGKIPLPGMVAYKDVNNDGHIDDNDMGPMFKNGVEPFLNLGWNFGLDYKGLSFRTNLVARFGGHLFYESQALTPPTVTNNVAAFWNDRWSLQNPNGWIPRADDANAKKVSTYWARDATMIRINNMSLAYTIPAKFLKNTGIGSVRVIITGNNLWTIINPFPYKDPYSSSIYDYPTIRTISAGLSIGI